MQKENKQKNAGGAAAAVFVLLSAAAACAVNLYCGIGQTNVNFSGSYLDGGTAVKAAGIAIFVFLLPALYLAFAALTGRQAAFKNQKQRFVCFAAALCIYSLIFYAIPTAYSVGVEILKHLLNIVYAYMLVCGFYRCITAVKNRKNKARFFLPAAIGLLFTVFVYLPLDSYINAYTDFAFTADIVLHAAVMCFAAAMAAAAVVLVLTTGRILKFTVILASALNLCVYLQYMFMNRNLELIDGRTLNVKENMGFGIVNMIIWLLVPAAFFVVYKISDKAKNIIVFMLPRLLTLIQLISLIIALVFLPADAWKIKALYYSGSDQFTVAPGKNIIVFVWDAFDNDHIEDIRKNEPELLDGFADFTVYTNTCSVYDTTNPSITQMFAGAEFDNTLNAAEFYTKAWFGEKAEVFYKRLHDRGYRVEFFNPSGCRAEYLDGKADNVCTRSDAEAREYKRLFNKINIAEYFQLVTRYRALPYLAKQTVDINSFNSDRLKVGNTNMNAIYSNDIFEKSLALRVDDNWENAFIMQHLDGTHNGDSPEHCLKITLDYIDGLKRLGLYENADIIVTADHGKHGHEAATPVFMVKHALQSEKPVFSAAPVYHEDILATLLTFAGCYSPDTDEAMFGKNIYAFDEDTKRERIWYDKYNDKNYPNVNIDAQIAVNQSSYNVFYKYVYTGDTKALAERISKGPNEILPMKEYY